MEDQVEKQVSNWMERLAISIKRAEEAYQQINNALASVMREPSSEDTSAKRTEAPAEQLVPLATNIRGNVWAIDKLSDQYQGMIGLLEL